MGFYSQQIVPRFIDKACGGADMKVIRDRTAAGLSGEIVELGFGSGLNMASYPEAVTLVHAIDPSGVGRQLSEPRVAASSISVAFDGVRGEELPLPDRSCDGALCTFTLCTIPDVDRALAELRRVLKPGAPFHFLEHGIAPDAAVRRWQHRLDPMQQRLADGCHLTRDPVELIRSAGFVLDEYESSYTRGPKPWVYFTRGRAHVPQIGKFHDIVR